jgi:hypothetical protein
MIEMVVVVAVEEVVVEVAIVEPLMDCKPEEN